MGEHFQQVVIPPSSGKTDAAFEEKHTKEMLEKVNGKTPDAPLAGNETKPEGQDKPTEGAPKEGARRKYADKYDTPEDLEKGYLELLRNKPEPKKPEAVPSQGDPKEGKPPEGKKDLTADQVQKLSEEHLSGKGFSEESKKMIVEAGLAPEFVAQYFEGQTAIARERARVIFDKFGGEDSYRELTNWAKGNLPEGEIDTFNEMVNSGDDSKVNMAVSGLVARYQQQNGAPPRKILSGENNSGAESAVEGYAGMYELSTAMKDPRYDKDPAYRAEVQRKAAKMK